MDSEESVGALSPFFLFTPNCLRHQTNRFRAESLGFNMLVFCMTSSFRTAAAVAALGALYGRAEHADLAKAIRVRTLVNLASGHETRILTNQNASAVLFNDLLAIPTTLQRQTVQWFGGSAMLEIVATQYWGVRMTARMTARTRG